MCKTFAKRTKKKKKLAKKFVFKQTLNRQITIIEKKVIIMNFLLGLIWLQITFYEISADELKNGLKDLNNNEDNILRIGFLAHYKSSKVSRSYILSMCSLPNLKALTKYLGTLYFISKYLFINLVIVVA